MLTDEDGDQAHEFFEVHNDKLIHLTPRPPTPPPARFLTSDQTDLYTFIDDEATHVTATSPFVTLSSSMLTDEDGDQAHEFFVVCNDQLIHQTSTKPPLSKLDMVWPKIERFKDEILQQEDSNDLDALSNASTPEATRLAYTPGAVPFLSVGQPRRIFHEVRNLQFEPPQQPQESEEQEKGRMACAEEGYGCEIIWHPARDEPSGEFVSSSDKSNNGSVSAVCGSPRICTQADTEELFEGERIETFEISEEEEEEESLLDTWKKTPPPVFAFEAAHCMRRFLMCVRSVSPLLVVMLMIHLSILHGNGSVLAVTGYHGMEVVGTDDIVGGGKGGGSVVAEKGEESLMV